MAKAKNDTNTTPNKFITEREVSGERRSIRHYNDGRVSSRRNSQTYLSNSLSRSTSSASVDRAKKDTFRNPSANSRASSTTPSAVGNAEGPETSSVVEALTILDPRSDAQKICHPFETTGSETETITLRQVGRASRPDLMCPKASIGSGSVHDRVVNIETNLKKFEKTFFGSIAEKEEEEKEQ
ncbi:uncharacterized protein N7529_002868 [Penicillium soppii]|uniref:uncharacterized protein n=1 Tax=Penicillium soppii TaxID=69789 RepID=UPI002546758F|nr:uncharacterized protein N7529_002868 [Penicillium soppii]KAJ5874438.1 hypothetical protein N7529_002868 [Penicillium soppii]